MMRFIKKLVPSFLIDKYHFLMALLGAFLYGFPSHLRQGFGGQAKKLKVIGVTGTNGKSTTIDLIIRILEEAGYKVAALSSIKFKIGEEERKNELRMTMPGRMRLQKFLREAVNAGCQYVVLEVTSEGIKQHRHRFIDFDCAVLTNLSPEHIEAHGSFENYKKAKGKFFKSTKNVHVINLDDDSASYFLQFSANKKYGFKISDNHYRGMTSIVKAEKAQALSSGIQFSVKGKEFNLKLLGGFNIYNALAAICVALSQEIDLETCKRALEKAKGIPGRMEIVISEPFTVFVDYAFTPNALEQVYQILTTNYKLQTTKLICVLGACGGGRDKWKRPVLGGLAGKYCDEIIVTNEDPYDEDPMAIINQITAGAKKISVNQRINQRKLAVLKILDRREAIREALTTAQARDVVVITGKGCEPSICLAGGKKIPWDDRRAVREEFQKLKKL